MRHKNKTALVTGASRGIGRAIALQLAKEGCKVGVHFRSREKEARDVVKKIQTEGGAAFLFQADLGKADDMLQLAEEAWVTLEGIDYLVNNAGVSYKKHFLDYDLTDVDYFTNVNFKGTLILTQAIARKMVETDTQGSIYTITSVNGIRAGLGLSVYGATKAALEVLMQGVAMELAPHNINVNTIALGAFQTELNETVWKNPDLLETVNKGIPLKRFGQPEEAASLISDLLASGSYLTGSSLTLDGGLLLMRGYGQPEKYSEK